MDSNPTSAPPPIPAPVTGPEFYPGAVYRINIDTDGDNHADVAFTFVFSEYENGRQTGTAWYATGAQARQPEPAGEVLSRRPSRSASTARPSPSRPAGSGCSPGCAATRSSPTSRAPCTASSGPGTTTSPTTTSTPSRWRCPTTCSAARSIGVWASISRHRDGVLEQLDRGGNPTINPFINPDGEKNLFNSRQPADDVANYLGPWSAILQNAGGYTPEQAKAAALEVLPDILHYDRTKPATYPNGRVPTDDVYSMRFAWLTNGKVPPSGLKPHDDLLAEFPYLGPPNPSR